jgi:hypothetical protein
MEFTEAEYQPPAELWCDGRTMEDRLPELHNVFRFSLHNITYVVASLWNILRSS